MFNFSKKQDCTKCFDRITELESRIKKLETENIDTTAQLSTIRDKVLRRFRGSDPPVELEKPENINTGFPFPFR